MPILHKKLDKKPIFIPIKSSVNTLNNLVVFSKKKEEPPDSAHTGCVEVGGLSRLVVFGHSRKESSDTLRVLLAHATDFCLQLFRAFSD